MSQDATSLQRAAANSCPCRLGKKLAVCGAAGVIVLKAIVLVRSP